MSSDQIVRKLESMELYQGGRLGENVAPWNNSTRSSIVGFPMDALEWCGIGDI